GAAVALRASNEAPGRARPAGGVVNWNRRFVALTAAYGLFGFGYVITATFIVTMVRGTPSIAPLEPYIWVLFGLSAAPAVALWVGLSRWIGVLPAYAAAALVEAAGVAGSAVWLNEVTVIAASL